MDTIFDKASSALYQGSRMLPKQIFLDSICQQIVATLQEPKFQTHVKTSSLFYAGDHHRVHIATTRKLLENTGAFQFEDCPDNPSQKRAVFTP